MQFYQVGRQKFGNKFLAFAESKRSGLPLTFSLFEEAFDCADWSQEPKTSWEDLLDIRARQIAALNRPIVLGFSGGTDSLTIYNVFKRNNIKISALFLRLKDNKNEFILYKDVIPFIEQEQKIHNFKVIYAKESEESLNKIYSSPDWVFNDMPVRVHFSVASGFTTIEDLPDYPSMLDTNFIFVLGLEKPRIKIINGQFYSYQQDTAYVNHCDPRHEYFFVSPRLPELHIKQSYMLAQYIVSESARTKQPLEYFNHIHNATEHDYLRYSLLGCGRHGDIANSDKQKILNRNSRLIIPNSNMHQYVYHGRSEEALRTGVLDNKLYARNYFQGLFNLRADSVFGQMFTCQDNYFSIDDLESKHYRLQILE